MGLSFDSTALERAATAARTLSNVPIRENSSNAKQALGTARLQEVTRQKEHDLSTKQEERRKTLGEETRHLKNLADYQDQLARKRAAEELAAQTEQQHEKQSRNRSIKQVFKRNEDPLKRVVLNLRLKTKSRVKKNYERSADQELLESRRWWIVSYLLAICGGSWITNILRHKRDSGNHDFNPSFCRAKYVESRDMEELIKSQLNDKQPVTDEFANLVILALNGNALSTLKGLPKLESLMSIDLSDNKLSASLDCWWERCPQLTHVNLSRNDIKEIEKLLPLKNLANLVCLDVMDCLWKKLLAIEESVEMIPHLSTSTDLTLMAKKIKKVLVMTLLMRRVMTKSFKVFRQS
uniref:ATPase family AAA domain-containing protein n=1 Tax=Ditylenchus dipsaci TaxID=166011 RepID=A0A915EBM4_9BILA